MSIVLFIIILAILILVHELGHFLIAKLFKIRVDEFGVGYPPRALTLFEWKKTKFTLNWLPFGGFVKIFGENGERAESEDMDAGKSFMEKPRYAQAAVLVAGVTFNLVFAWILISLGFIHGLPTSVDAGIAGDIQNPKLVITTVAPGSPARDAGLHSGDVISDVVSNNAKPASLTPDVVSEFIAHHGDDAIKISYVRGSEAGTLEVRPKEGIIEGRKAVGISMDTVGTLVLPFHKAFIEGAKTTVSLTKVTAESLAIFVYDTFRGKSNFSQVTGPVGIVGLVGDASQLGFIYLLSFTAFISINLAVVNVIPFPALDGGRLLFVLIEAIKRSPISPKVTNAVNAVGFFLLIGLMVLVTIQDVVKLF